MATKFALLPRGQRVALEPTSSHSDDNSNVYEQVTSIYESYAALYPNPRLVKEIREREKLDRALSAASQAIELNPPRPKRWLDFLWKAPVVEQKAVSSSPDDNRIVYDEEEQDDDDEDSELLGTQRSLDTTCIPLEAHSSARLHMASRRSFVPNVARTSWEVAGSSVMVIVGVGELIEFDRSGGAQQQHTNDRNELQTYIAATQSQFHVMYVRAALIGPNLLCFSWGLQDGVIVFYRRRIGGDKVPWEAVACVSPIEATKSSLRDVFVAEENAESPMLRVTDIVPLVVETETIPGATLAISRLGGFIELINLPSGMWYGPEITPSERKRRRRKDRHYTSSLVDLASKQELITALASAEYHDDIICMEPLRTRVGNDTVWDGEAYPSGPPAEHILAASGMRDGREVLTFWSASTIFGDEPTTFTLHTTLAEAIDLGQLGPTFTIFVTPTIVKHWRKPRHVHLLDDASLTRTHSVTGSEAIVRTISVAAPICSIRFNTAGGTLYLSLLDWNGGVTLMNGGLLERSVAQCLSVDEYELLYRNDDPNLIVPLVRTVADRARVSLGLSRQMATVVEGVRWLRKRLSKDPSVALLALVTAKPQRLLVLGVEESAIEAVSSAPLHDDCSAILTNRVGELVVLSQSSRPGECFLGICVLDVLDPRSIIQALVRDSKFKEAVEASRHLTREEEDSISDVLEMAKMHLWKTGHDIEALGAIQDVKFVVQEALDLGEHSGVGTTDEGKLSLFRDIHAVALARLNSQWHTVGYPIDLDRKLRARLVRLGTYVLLCNHFSCDKFYSSFCSFLGEDLLNMAIAFARSADIAALTMACFRHRHETMKNFEVVDAIPLSVSPALYCHLLPLGGFVVDGFLTATHKRMDWSELPEYADSTLGIVARLFLDEEDKALVLSQSNPSTLLGDATMEESLVSWCAARARMLESFTGSLNHIVDILGIAVSFGVDEDAVSLGSASESTTPVADALRRSQANLSVLMQCSSSEIFESPLCTAGVMNTAAFNLQDSLQMLFGTSGSDPEDLEERFSVLIRPFCKSLDVLDEAVVGYFVERIAQGIPGRLASPNDSIRLLHVMQVCALVCELSRVSIDKASRLISNPESAWALVLSIYDRMREVIFDGSVTGILRSDLVERLWRLYECLPMGVAGELDSRSNDMFEGLVVAGILSQWPCNETYDLISPDQILRSICRSVSDQGSTLDGSYGFELWKDLMVDLRIDISELTGLRTFASVDFSTILAEVLLLPILRYGDPIIIEATVDSTQRWLDRETVKTELISVINDVVFGDRTDTSLRAAVACQNVLQRGFPDAELDAWRYLQAASFINDLLPPGVSDPVLKTGNLRKEYPLDVVEAVLGLHPDIVLHQCEQWKDPSWAAYANTQLRAFRSQSLPDQGIMRPFLPIPGSSVLELARLLGMRSAASLAVVSCRAVHHAISTGYFGAAAAICRVMLLDETPVKLRPLVVVILNVVCNVIARDGFEDFETKKELFSELVRFATSELSLAGLEQFSTAVRTVKSIEYEMFGVAIEPNVLPRSEPHVVRTLLDETWSEYGTDLANLFATFGNHAGECYLDPSLLGVIGRFVIYWCISRVIRPRASPQAAITTGRVQYMAEFGASILCHTQDAHEILDDLRRILSEQMSIVTSQPNVWQPRSFPKAMPEIVHRLVGRGYSQQAARRAATMTHNQGFDAALQWAVAHTLDDDFDSPMVSLRPPDAVSWDETGAMDLNNCLILAETVLLGHLNAVEGFPSLPNITADTEEGKSKTEERENMFDDDDAFFAESEHSVPETNVSQVSGFVMDLHGAVDLGPTSSHDESPGEDPNTQGAELDEPSSPNRNGDPIHLTGAHANIESPGQSADDTEIGSGSREFGDLEDSGALKFDPPTVDEGRPTVIPSLTVAMPELLRNETLILSTKGRGSGSSNGSMTIPNSLPSDSKSQIPIVLPIRRSAPTVPPPPPPPVVRRAAEENKPRPPLVTKSHLSTFSRSNLRELGQVALQQSRGSGSPSAEDRRNLIEAGRRLLQQARSLKDPAVPVAAPVSAPPPSFLHQTDEDVAPACAVPTAVKEGRSDGGERREDGWDFDEDF